MTSFPKGVGLTLNVVGSWLLQLCHHTNTGGFLLLSVENDKCATPSTLGAQGEQHIQPTLPYAQNANGRIVKQILTGHRVLKSSKSKF